MDSANSLQHNYIHTYNDKTTDNITLPNNQVKVKVSPDTHRQRIAEFVTKHSFILKMIGCPVYYGIGVLYYTTYEKWTVIESFYFITATITTCGYGFFHPTTNSAKIFTIFYMFIGLIIIFTVIQGLADNYLSDAQEELIRLLSYVKSNIYKNNEVMIRSTMLQYKIFLSLVSVFSFAFIGTLFFASNENWTVIDALYWTVCTMTTVGYGR